MDEYDDQLRQYCAANARGDWREAIKVARLLAANPASLGRRYWNKTIASIRAEQKRKQALWG